MQRVKRDPNIQSANPTQTPSQSSFLQNSINIYRIPRRRQLGPTPRKDLCPRLNTLQTLPRTQLKIRLQVLIEVQQIAIKGCSGALRDEAVNDDVAIVASDQIESYAADCGRCDGSRRVAVVAEGRDATKDAEPDHDLVGLGGGGGGTEEGIVGDIGTEGGSSVAIKRHQLA